jgi:hypothetical protein
VGCRQNLVGDPNSGAPHTIASWFNPAALAAPPATQTTETTERPGAIRGPGFWRTDLSLFKNIKLTERLTGQFRWETFNTFNHTNPICCGSANMISSLYNTIASTRDPRIMQVGIKLNFWSPFHETDCNMRRRMFPPATFVVLALLQRFSGAAIEGQGKRRPADATSPSAGPDASSESLDGMEAEFFVELDGGAVIRSYG